MISQDGGNCGSFPARPPRRQLDAQCLMLASLALFAGSTLGFALDLQTNTADFGDWEPQSGVSQLIALPCTETFDWNVTKKLMISTKTISDSIA